MKISDLRARVMIQSKLETTNSRGGVDTIWVDEYKSWCKFVTKNKNDAMSFDTGDDLIKKSSHFVTMRYDNKITPVNRIVYEDDYYKINSVSRSDNGKRKYLLLAVQWEGSLR